MWTTAFKGLLAHKLRLAATALAVTLGVTFLAGTLILTDTIGRTFDNLFADVYKDTDGVVRAEAAFEGTNQTGDQRGRVPVSLTDAVRSVAGVAVAEGQIFGYARLIGKDGEPIGNPENGAPVVGANWSDIPELNAFRLAEGQPPRGPDDVVIDLRSARDGDLEVGDTTTVLVQGPPRTVRIAGIARFGEADSPGGASFVLFPAEVAERAVAEPGKVDSIALVAENGVSQEELVRRVRAVLPAGVEGITGRAITEETQDLIHSVLSFFNTFMLMFAVIALLVGGFMIFNTFSITVAQRSRDSALLRALGATRRQVLASVLAEALVVGVLASLAGLGTGLLVAQGLQALLKSMGFLDMSVGSTVFAARTVILSLVVGTAVTVFAAVSPARKASKVPPVAAMGAVATGSSGYGSKQRILVGSAILALGVAALLYGLFGDPASPLAMVGLGAVLVFFGVSALGRTVSLPLSRILGAPLPRLRGVAGELARENAMRNPKRTASSASALMIGVGLVAFITILAASTKTSVNAAIDRAFTGDFVIDSGGGPYGGLDPGLAGRMAALPEVESATGLRIGMARVNGHVRDITALDPATAFEIVDIQAQEGSPADLTAETIAIHRDIAEEERLGVGDTVPVLFKDSGERQLRVALVYDEDAQVGRHLLSMAAYEANFTNRLDNQVLVKTTSGTTPAQAQVALEEATRAYGAEVMDQADLKAEAAQEVDQMLALIYALLGLAIFIALLGVGNTLALSILERVHELGLLRAVGMTRSQLRSTIRWESVIIALQGTVLGLLIGIFFGWALVTALADEGIDHFRIPILSLLVVVVLAALAGVLAAVLPSRRAARLNVLRAIVHD